MALSCSSRPAHFRDADAVTTVVDDNPIALPQATEVPDWARYTDVYVRRAVVGALDPRRARDSVDVNALDEVPTSSWFDARRSPLLEGYATKGLPAEPFEELPVDAKRADERVMIDAGGQRWLLVLDEAERPGLRTGAGAIASRLFYALGYHATDAHIVSLTGGRRALAVRWPSARAPYSKSETFAIGPTVSTGTRLDDPNDVVPHEDRRTLRALGTIAAWMGLDQIRSPMLRDVYVGPPGEGFVQHQIVSLDDALGAGALRSALSGDEDGAPPRNAWLALGSLGFAPKEGPDPSDTPFPSVGIFPFHVDVTRYGLSVPFPPANDALLADVYWAAKRIARVPDGTIVDAVASAELEPNARKYLERALEARRLDIARIVMSLVTPLELARTTPVSAKRAAGERFELRLDDRAILLGVAKASESRYEVELSDAEGDALDTPSEVAASKSTVVLGVPPDLLDRHGYVIVRVRAVRGGVKSPRSMEIHLRGDARTAQVRGIRH
ncbi:MAG: hypothetical protein JNK04_09965 [Myxococcales bacterium]|nr:hypothetical protein [Myxococcales bacterium]